MADMFRALVAEQADGRTLVKSATVEEIALPAGDVTIDVAYSSLNYKDGLALTGRGKVIRKWPMVPGIDLAGRVRSTSSSGFHPGDPVLVTGYGLGVSWWGGFSQRARVKDSMVLRIPEGLDARSAMAIGTAGFTAMLCIMALEDRGLTPAHGEILVTGATGGVGSVAVAILAHRGYRVVASTGKTAEAAYLKSLGAAEVIDRNTLNQPGKPLQKQRWAGTVDSVGSHTQANACAQTLDEGVVTACGLAQGMDFPVTVAPFILRGVKLDGINSVTCPMERRRRAWVRLEKELDGAKLASMVTEIGLADALERAPDVIAGKHRGRLVVDVNR